MFSSEKEIKDAIHHLDQKTKNSVLGDLGEVLVVVIDLLEEVSALKYGTGQRKESKREPQVKSKSELRAHN